MQRFEKRIQQESPGTIAVSVWNANWTEAKDALGKTAEHKLEFEIYSTY